MCPQRGAKQKTRAAHLSHAQHPACCPRGEAPISLLSCASDNVSLVALPATTAPRRNPRSAAGRDGGEERCSERGLPPWGTRRGLSPGGRPRSPVYASSPPLQLRWHSRQLSLRASARPRLFVSGPIPPLDPVPFLYRVVIRHYVQRPSNVYWRMRSRSLTTNTYQPLDLIVTRRVNKFHDVRPMSLYNKQRSSQFFSRLVPSARP